MSDLLNTHFRFEAVALSLRAERQQVLASNIANADTPNYKARDIDFRSALQHALGGAAGPQLPGFSSAPALGASHPLHFGASNSAVRPALLYRIPHQDSIDGNSVELDAERAQFADNALRYEAELSSLNSKIKNLNAVLQGS